MRRPLLTLKCLILKSHNIIKCYIIDTILRYEILKSYLYSQFIYIMYLSIYDIVLYVVIPVKPIRMYLTIFIYILEYYTLFTLPFNVSLSYLEHLWIV